MTHRPGRKRHSPQQIVSKLREADALLAGGASNGQVCQHPASGCQRGDAAPLGKE